MAPNTALRTGLNLGVVLSIAACAGIATQTLPTGHGVVDCGVDDWHRRGADRHGSDRSQPWGSDPFVDLSRVGRSIPVADACARLGRTAMLVVLGTTVLQVAFGTAMIGFIVP